MSATTYFAPDNPADPEAAALELIVRISDLIPEAIGLPAILQDYCSLLHAEGAFTDLPWPDAKQIAAAVAADVCVRGDDAAQFMRNRARNVLSGRDNMPWENRDGAARALNIAAEMLELEL